jgi:ABC-type branched-subunit amino acid transport system substrate-binding protein
MIGAMCMALLAAGFALPSASAQANGPVTVKIAVIGDSPTGTAGNPFAVLPDLEHGVNAAAKAIAKQGKIKFDISICDAQGDSNKLGQCARNAVSSGVAAVFALSLAQGQQMTPVLQDAGVAAFWGATIPLPGSTDDTSPISMLPTSPTLATYGMLGAGPAVNGFTSNAVVMTASISEGVTMLAEKAYKGEGGKSLSEVDIPFAPPGTPNAPDPAPHAAEVAAKNPNVVLMSAAPANYVQPLREANVNAPLILVDSSDPTMIDQPLAALPSNLTKNIYKVSPFPPFDLVKPIPAVKQFQQDMKAVGAGKVNQLTPYAWNEWVGMYALASVAQTLPTADAKSLLSGLNSAKNIKLVTGATWTPSAVGPPGFTRDSTAVGYISKYVGINKWVAAKPGPNGLRMDTSIFG